MSADQFMEEDSLPAFGSQDDALLLQAYEAYESRVKEEDATEADKVGDGYTFWESESQEMALHLACEEFEQNVVSAAATTGCSSDDLSNLTNMNIIKNNDQSQKAKSETESSGQHIHEVPEPTSKSIFKCRIQPGPGGGYLTVTNLVSQLWCEQQMEYGREVPKVIMKVLQDTPAMAAGDKIHKERDLEVNKYVEVKPTTAEDYHAICLVNIISHLKSLLLFGKCCIREIAVFGMPFGQELMFTGIVDELRFNSQDQLELVEFKTRGNTSMPIGNAQMKGYKMQTMLYKQLLDELVDGRVDGKTVLLQWCLDPDYILQDELTAVIHDRTKDFITLGQLMTMTLNRFQFLPHVQVLTVEISSQSSGTIVAKETVEFDFDWLSGNVRHCLAYWKGERETEGVDIEDAWKCRSCLFYDDCGWREKMNQIYAHKNCLNKTNGK